MDLLWKCSLQSLWLQCVQHSFVLLENQTEIVRSIFYYKKNRDLYQKLVHYIKYRYLYDVKLSFEVFCDTGQVNIMPKSCGMSEDSNNWDTNSVSLSISCRLEGWYGVHLRGQGLLEPCKKYKCLANKLSSYRRTENVLLLQVAWIVVFYSVHSDACSCPWPLDYLSLSISNNKQRRLCTCQKSYLRLREFVSVTRVSVKRGTNLTLQQYSDVTGCLFSYFCNTPNFSSGLRWRLFLFGIFDSERSPLYSAVQETIVMHCNCKFWHVVSKVYIAVL